MKNKRELADASSSRRGFLGKLWLLLGGVALAEAVWIVSDFFKPRRRRVVDNGADSIIVAGSVDRFEPGSVTAFPEGRFYLARLADGGFLALHRECTHLGCTVPWVAAEDRFVCPCHASSFDITGDVLSPPAPRPLDLFPVRIENSIVKVDISKTIKRQSFVSSQVVRS
jgi:cytochrome b6-f complex iron-sulfur subunit